MSHFLLLILSFVTLAVTASHSTAVTYKDVIIEEWNAFKLKHGKSYPENEENFRMKVFMENKHFIAKHNQRASNGYKSYTLAMNNFGDLLHHEFVALMNGYKRPFGMQKINGSTFLSPLNTVIPDEIDWRIKGYVTDIKDQKHCGSCWSFSTTGSLEGQHMRKSGKLISLSEQNLIDCSRKYGNNGCEGGLMDYAFQYIKDNHGVDTEMSYPYEAKDARCRFKPIDIGATDTGFVDVESGSEDGLKSAVATVGPVSVAIDASHQSFQFYSKGVYDETECGSSEESLDHGVLVVGYGVTTDNVEYWIVKNSWGKVWGDAGYIKMIRNKNNQCGIATSASYPLV